MSSEFAIRCENLGKRYLVPARQQDAGSMGSLVGHLKEYTSLVGRDDNDYFWALRNVSFEIKRGEILGIVGRNGSGKSTLLKILSGVTDPTEGRAEIRGRVGSLLEVGTGFHPDMTGRENVFMAGALLGLSQSEIAAKLDEIIDFAEIDRFIDVPVKRYSSGMYVRLAFSVASLLRSDILILDEVLAVGDAAFKEKSRRNINAMVKDGRTVVFVSHNLQELRAICERGVYLASGKVQLAGPIDEVVESYKRDLTQLAGMEREDYSDSGYRDLSDKPGLYGERDQPVFKWVETLDGAGRSKRSFKTGETLIVRMGYEAPFPSEKYYFTVFVINELGDRILVSYNLHDPSAGLFPQRGIAECHISDLRLVSGYYSLAIDFGIDVGNALSIMDWIPDVARIKVDLGDYLGPLGLTSNQGYFAQRCEWRSIQIEDGVVRTERPRSWDGRR